MPIAVSSGWRKVRVNYPSSLGSLLKISMPRIDSGRMYQSLKINPNSFVKWDARPGNAAVREDGKVFWFDWEHCSRRAGIDDLIWFLCDDWIEDDEEMETSILKDSLSFFNKRELNVPLLTYIYLHGTLHMCGRLVKILEKKGKLSWWDRDYCLKF